MTVMATITYSCGGCEAEAITDQIRMPAQYVSAFGGPLIKVREVATLAAEDYTPDGWVAYDPYTLATYCGKCWDGIESDVPA